MRPPASPSRLSSAVQSPRSGVDTAPSTRHRADIDGLRALAILPVVAFHAGVPGITGGFVGVDIFFVISGYLITAIVKGEVESQSFTFGNFYERRIRRIMPALLFVIACTLIVAGAYLFAGDFMTLARSAIYCLLFLGNFYFAAQSGYFSPDAHTQPLLHLWSLAVEEQFYILLPLLLVVIARFGKSSIWLPSILWSLAVASFVGSAVLLPTDPGGVFYLLPGRAWELLAGALLAVDAIRLPRQSPIAEVLAWIGLILIVGSCLLIDETTPFPGPAALPAVSGALLLLRYGEQTLIGRILAQPLLVGIGLVSYPLYLWHWPVLVIGQFASLAPVPLVGRLILVGISLALAVFTYVVIETPFRTRSFLATGRPLVVGVSALVLVLLIGAVSVLSQSGFPARFPPAVVALANTSQDFSPARGACHLEHDFDLRPFARACVFGQRGAPPRFAFWGDSHAAELSATLGEQLGKQGKSILELSNSACPPVLDTPMPGRGNCAAQNDIDVQGIAASASIHTVFLVAHYGQYRPSTFFPGFIAAVDRLLDSGKHVVIVYPVPGLDRNAPLALAKAALLGEDPATVGMPRELYEMRVAGFLRTLDWLTASGGLGVVRPSDLLCGAHRCSAYISDTAIYFDDNHLSMGGARLVGKLFAPYLG